MDPVLRLRPSESAPLPHPTPPCLVTILNMLSGPALTLTQKEMELHIKLLYIYCIQLWSYFILITRRIYQGFYFLLHVRLRPSPSFPSL